MSTHHATGPFDVKVVPQSPSAQAERAGIGRMTLDKQFHGDLEATSSGEMLAFGNPSGGSAGYVAMETVTGTLQGRSGSFVLQHSSTMTRGVPQQSVGVVPDSGTGDLVGLAGSMTIVLGGGHAYDFRYTLPD